jgi:hypothetical protein
MSNSNNRGPSIDASYQVSVYWDQVVSEVKIQMWKVNRQGTPSDGKSSHGLLARWAKTEKDPFSFDPVLCVAVNDINS